MSSYDIASPLDRTPPFIRWTLVRACPLRGDEDLDDPERTERLLRGVQSYSDAVIEGRCRDGIVVQRHANASDAPLGFDVAAVLEPLGGIEEVVAACRGCPANAGESINAAALAGCVGLLIPPDDHASDFHRVVAEILERAKSDFEPLKTNPRWFGLWIDPHPSRELLTLHRLILTEVALRCDHPVIGSREYLAAIDAALHADLSLTVHAYPGGRCEGRKWYVEPHCGGCQAAWPEAKRQQCRVCDHVGGRQPEQRRLRIGVRPYRPLSEFLPNDSVRKLLGRSA